ncbi:hypothetical protein [Citreimonas salinaria]|uniref:Uncharacterized protein n=1 Tax=Citreimonas salinaria TaxID=321339 RepID=A0A1H3N0F7_9RHOB|nr:hypothetical protein [Citreimonas salinaria]SDY81719.1 hypothetical protein SAMN05444340_11938 [Citreimonas salinaria]
MKIVIYEVEERERVDFRHLERAHEVSFVQEPLSSSSHAAAEHADAEDKRNRKALPYPLEENPMLGCLMCETPRDASRCPEAGCHSVVLRISDPMGADVTRLQRRLRGSGLRKRYARQLACQITDLGFGAIVLPRVDNVVSLLDELSGMKLDARVVEESTSKA